MKPVVDMSGGMVVQTDTFLNPVFKESFKRVFAPPGDPGALDIASNATFEVWQQTPCCCNLESRRQAGKRLALRIP